MGRIDWAGVAKRNRGKRASTLCGNLPTYPYLKVVSGLNTPQSSPFHVRSQIKPLICLSIHLAVRLMNLLKKSREVKSGDGEARLRRVTEERISRRLMHIFHRNW